MWIMTAFSRQPAQKESSAENPPITRPASRAPEPRKARAIASLRVGCGRESRRAFREHVARVEDSVGTEPSLCNHGYARLEDVRQGALVFNRHRRRAVL